MSCGSTSINPDRITSEVTNMMTPNPLTASTFTAHSNQSENNNNFSSDSQLPMPSTTPTLHSNNWKVQNPLAGGDYNSSQTTTNEDAHIRSTNKPVSQSMLPIGGIRVPNPFLQNQNGSVINTKPQSNNVTGAPGPYSTNMNINSDYSTNKPTFSDMNMQFSPGTSQPGEKNIVDSNANNRRQKRLERNRESARLSRRRRKQYLEVLEDRVSSLSVQMDEGRIKRAAEAVPSTKKLREDRIASIEQELQKLQLDQMNNNDSNNQNQLIESESLKLHDRALHTLLSRSSNNLRIIAAFQKEQQKSYVLPPHVRFIQWLTLQNDSFFLGGRAASERLSAARIGERMLNAGNDRVPPALGMWPLLCNEINLSYDQEERVRNFQRSILSKPNSWLEHRHSTTASGKVNDTLYNCLLNLSEMSKQREQKTILSILTLEQRAKLHVWLNKQSRDKRDQIMSDIKGTFPSKTSLEPQLKTSPTYHNATNIYIINNHLESVLNSNILPATDPLVHGQMSLKRLSRRPPFESLGGAGNALSNDNKGMDRDNSFSSSGSLKRSASSLSQTQDRFKERSSSISSHGDIPGQNHVTPEAAQAACHSAVVEALKPAGIELPERVCFPPQHDHQATFAMPETTNSRFINNNSNSSSNNSSSNNNSSSSNNNNNTQFGKAPVVSPPPITHVVEHVESWNWSANTYPVDEPYSAADVDPLNNLEPNPVQQPNSFAGARSVSVPSILPSSNGMNAVPEDEEFNANQDMEDYFLDLGDNDWTIGGFDVEAEG